MFVILLNFNLVFMMFCIVVYCEVKFNFINLLVVIKEFFGMCVILLEILIKFLGDYFL